MAANTFRTKEPERTQCLLTPHFRFGTTITFLLAHPKVSIMNTDNQGGGSNGPRSTLTLELTLSSPDGKQYYHFTLLYDSNTQDNSHTSITKSRTMGQVLLLGSKTTLRSPIQRPLFSYFHVWQLIYVAQPPWMLCSITALTATALVSIPVSSL